MSQLHLDIHYGWHILLACFNFYIHYSLKNCPENCSYEECQLHLWLKGLYSTLTTRKTSGEGYVMLKMHERLTEEMSAWLTWPLIRRMVWSVFKSKWNVSEIWQNKKKWNEQQVTAIKYQVKYQVVWNIKAASKDSRNGYVC